MHLRLIGADFEPEAKRTKDPVKMAAELLLAERAYTTGEARYGVSFWRDGLKFNRRKIRWMAKAAAVMIEIRRDEGRIGTQFYQGLAYFWAHKYRFHLRGEDSTNKRCRAVHHALLKEGLELGGTTARHDQIVDEACGTTTDWASN
jgi:hypothetical protein